MSEASWPLIGCRVLVVEDEYLIAMELKRWLTSEGIEVIGPVPSVEQALDLIDDEDMLDAAVLDLNLGGGETAYPVADRLSALKVPFVFATGDVRVGSDTAYSNQPRLEKPILAPELLRSLGELIGASPNLVSHAP